MNFKKYIKNTSYILKHKKYIFKAYDELCKNEKIDKDTLKLLKKHCYVHDLSKFSIKEFFSYTEFFFNKDSYFDNSKTYMDESYYIKFKYTQEGLKESFQKALEHHYKKNKHHWNYFCSNKKIKYMPEINVLQMLLDLTAVGLDKRNTAKEFYDKNKDNMKLDYRSRTILEYYLGYYDDIANKQKITIDDIKRLIPECIEIRGYLQGGYGTWIQGKNNNTIFNMPVDSLGERVLGGDLKILNLNSMEDEDSEYCKIITKILKDKELDQDNKKVNIW